MQVLVRNMNEDQPHYDVVCSLDCAALLLHDRLMEGHAGTSVNFLLPLHEQTLTHIASRNKRCVQCDQPLTQAQVTRIERPYR